MEMTIRYGKARVVFYRLAKRSAPPFAAQVDIEVFGERFRAAYTQGDNREVVATDTMKNFVYATAAEFGGTSLEAYVAFLGERLLATYPQMETIRVAAREVPLDPAPGTASDVLFRMTRADVATAEARFARDGGRVTMSAARSGIEGMRLLKTTGSSFAEFARDAYTTLPDLVDRPLTIGLDLAWWYADQAAARGSGPGHVPADVVRREAEGVFGAFDSRSIQHLVHEIGQRVLAAHPAIERIELNGENRTPDGVAAGEGDVRVFAEPRQTFGRIGLLLRR